MIIPFFLSMEGCPFQCVYCQQQSITGEAGRMAPDQIRQKVEEFLQAVPEGSPSPEAAFFGGTFTALPRKRQADLLEALAPLVKAGRLSSIRVSTRPDSIDEEGLELLREGGVETIELGVQSLNAAVLEASRRGYGPQDVVRSCQKIKKSGFRLGIQLMLGLPGDTPERARASAQEAVWLKPDLLRVYPTLVFAGTALARAYQQGDFQPWSLHQAVAVGADLLDLFTGEGIPVIRWGLQATSSLARDLVAGPWHPAYGELVRQELLVRWLERGLSQFQQSHKENFSWREAILSCPANRLSLLKGHGQRPLRRLQSRWELADWTLQPLQKLDSYRFILELSGGGEKPILAVDGPLEFLKNP